MSVLGERFAGEDAALCDFFLVLKIKKKKRKKKKKKRGDNGLDRAPWRTETTKRKKIIS